MFAVKLVIFFLPFTVSEENTVKCLEGSSDILGDGLRKSSEIIRMCCKMAENCLIY